MKTELKIDWANHESVVYACKHWHYSKTVPVPPIVKVGVWENNKFIGVVLFSRGASSSLLKPYGLSQTQGCELSRVALAKHSTPVTKIIKIAIIYLKKLCPEMQLIVSFADPEQGHEGIIYKAGNWISAGQTEGTKTFFFRDRKLHSRQVSEKGWNVQQGNIRRTIKPSQCIVKKNQGKYRYLYPISENMKNQLRDTRATDATSIRAADQYRPSRSNM